MKPVGKGERVLVYIVFGCVDLVQIVLDIFVVTEIANHVIDVVAGAVLLLYGQKRKLWTGNKLLVLGAVFIGEQIPFVNALPFWTLDVRNLYSGVPREAVAQETDENLPLNMNGMRCPEARVSALNKDGMRLPNGGLKTGK